MKKDKECRNQLIPNCIEFIKYNNKYIKLKGNQEKVRLVLLVYFCLLYLILCFKRIRCVYNALTEESVSLVKLIKPAKEDLNLKLIQLINFY